MSAAAGISAAKKRRGVVSTGPDVQSTPVRPGQQPQPQQQQAPLVTPIQILQNHELRLKHIEKQLSDADEYANMYMNENEKKTGAQAQTQVSVPLPVQVVETTSPLLKVYIDECETLKHKVEELTQLVHKVQTFSMESNLAFLKLKRSIDEDVETRIRELKQTDESFENRIQELKQTYTSDYNNVVQSVKFETAAALSALSASTTTFGISSNTELSSSE